MSVQTLTAAATLLVHPTIRGYFL